MKAMKNRFIYTIACVISLLMALPVDIHASINDLHQQTLVVKGTIKDKSGEPFPGVSVVVKGTLTGIITDVEGYYSISVPNENSVLVISYVGFVSQEPKYMTKD